MKDKIEVPLERCTDHPNADLVVRVNDTPDGLDTLRCDECGRLIDV